MRTWGLTGGVGMGKSTAARVLASCGLAVIDTDQLVRELTQSGSDALTEIVRAFGISCLDTEGSLNRQALARLVFSDASARSRLESILHPRIRAAWKAQVEQWRKEGRDAVVVVIPLLFETAAESELDFTVCVACSEASQRMRLRERGWDDLQISQRIGAQWPIERKMAASDYVIWTEGPVAMTEAQLRRIAW